MSNLITHTTNAGGRSVQAYAVSGSDVKLDMNNQLDEDGKPFYSLTLLEALALCRILEASIRDAQQGTYQAPESQES